MARRRRLLPTGRYNITNARFKADFSPIYEGLRLLHLHPLHPRLPRHLFKADERLAATLASIHNGRFIVRIVDDARKPSKDGTYFSTVTVPRQLLLRQKPLNPLF